MDRRGFIGGSDCVKIMQGDWQELWEIKTNRRKPDDLSDNLAVQLGTFTERFNLEWFEKQQCLQNKKGRNPRNGTPTWNASQECYSEEKNVGGQAKTFPQAMPWRRHGNKRFEDALRTRTLTEYLKWNVQCEYEM